MEQREYKERLAALLTQYEADKKKLHREYALSNNPYKIGDMFTDHQGTIRIEKISTYLSSWDFPQCVYTGIIINKDGKESKVKNNRRNAFQQNESNPLTEKLK
jgi:hypothetical protein